MTAQSNYSTTKEKRSSSYFSSRRKEKKYFRVGDNWELASNDEEKRKSKERKELKERLKQERENLEEYEYVQYVPLGKEGFCSMNYKAKKIRNLYDPQNKTFSMTPYHSDDPKLQLERKHFEDWCYETSLSLWEKKTYQEFCRSLEELKQLSAAAMDGNRRYVFAEDHYNEIAKNKNVEEFLHQAKDLLDDMRTWINELKAKIRTEIKTLESGAVFLVSRSFLSAPRTSSRSRRSPVRSAAKAGDDGGGDGDSDGPGEPPGPVLTVPSLQTFLFNHQLNSSILSRTPLPCSWCMDWRWAA